MNVLIELIFPVINKYNLQIRMMYFFFVRINGLFSQIRENE